MNSREVVRLLEEAGFESTGRGKGDHQVYKHRDTGPIVSVVHPQRDIKIGLLIAYEKQSGIKLRRR